MPTKVFNTGNAIKSMRKSGIKNVSSAIAELVDNSIDAQANNVHIVVFEKEEEYNGRFLKKIDSIAIIDDGKGMSKDYADACFAFGEGEGGKEGGLGKFGYGLGNASISVCTKTEVFTWQEQNSNKILYNVFDLNEIENQNIDFLPDAIEKNITNNAIKSKVKDFKSGTVIIWNNCDLLKIKQGETLFRHIEKQITRTFRHHLDDDDTYGVRINLTFEVYGNIALGVKSFKTNDPLYLMTPNNLAGYENQPTNEEVFRDTIPIAYLDENKNAKQAEITFIFTVAKPEIQALGGGSKIGNHYGENTGISVVRNAREIQLSDFKFYNGFEARERWWGCEIRFDERLDDIFGLSNNKQYVHNFTNIKDTDIKDIEDSEIDLSMKMNIEISKIFKSIHGEQATIIRRRGSGNRTNTPSEDNPNHASKIANDVLRDKIDTTKSKLKGDLLSEEQRKNELREILKQNDPEMSIEDIMKNVETEIELKKKVEVSYGDWPGSQFFTVEMKAGTAYAKINREHEYYKQHYEKVRQLEDSKYIQAIDLLFLAFARMEDESLTDSSEFSNIRENWGRYLNTFLKKLTD